MVLFVCNGLFKNDNGLRPTRPMKMRNIAALVFLVLPFQTVHDVQINCWGPSEADTQSRELRDQFPPLDPSRGLYSVNEDERYALQAFYYPQDLLGKIRVVPKYFFDELHPEWKHPEHITAMSPENYKAVLTRIDGVKALGQLIKRGELGVTDNGRTYFTDEYEKAFVERAMFRNSPDEPYGISWFTVMYLRPVSGNVESKNSGLENVDAKYMVKIGGKWFRTKQKVFANLKVGKRASIEAAGPVED